jgi:ABC-type multidrug transport system ATPase subunit
MIRSSDNDSCRKDGIAFSNPHDGQVLLNRNDARRAPLKAMSIVEYCPDDPVLCDKVTGIQFLSFIADVLVPSSTVWPL